MTEIESLLEESVKLHGHLCPGQVLGVRMSMLGLRKIGIEDPKGKDKKNLIVFVEMDRCATDAIQSVTGCSLGKRTMKFLDYGKMAVTFLNLKTKEAVRVYALEEARERAQRLFPHIEDKYGAQLEAYKIMPNNELFKIEKTTISIKEEDMPGRPLSRVPCSLCKEYIQDRREIYIDGKPFCKPCAKGVFLSTAVQNIHSGLMVRSKIWLEVEGEPVFGRGRRFLLEAIARNGSISQAAKEINISYRKAWSYIRAMEERLGLSLVRRRTGGKDGGGAELTEEAYEFLKIYKALEDGVKDIVDERFRYLFKGGKNV